MNLRDLRVTSPQLCKTPLEGHVGMPGTIYLFLGSQGYGNVHHGVVEWKIGGQFTEAEFGDIHGTKPEARPNRHETTEVKLRSGPAKMITTMW